MENYVYTLEDLLIAFRKVKTDIYFDNNYDNLIKLATYEENLIENLRRLRDMLNHKSIEDIYSEDLIGDFKYILKDIDFEQDYDLKNKGFVYYSNQIEAWDSIRIKNIAFRFIGWHSVDFHVICSLWIDKVGVYLEAYLNEKSYGGRLKRINQSFNQFVNKNSDHDEQAYKLLNGHFRPYYWDYKRWQEDGIKAIEDAMKKDKKIIVLTADIRKFYPSVSADFLLDKEFYSFLLQDYRIQIHPLTYLLVDLLNHWNIICLSNGISKDVLKNESHCGLPVGLSASKVIANLYLAYFDSKITNEINPIHYGRYVDDVLLVIENNRQIKNSKDLWTFISSRIEECRVKFESNETAIAEFKSPFGRRDKIEFGQGKEKLFILEGDSGDSFIETLKESMNENSSEWRLLPDSDEEIENLSKQIASSNSSIEEQVNSLRKSDGLSIQRLRFALRLRNFESLVDLVPKAVWIKGFYKFMSICESFIISPQQFPTYLRYYPRIIGLAVRAKEYKLSNKLIERINECWGLVDAKAKNLNLFLEKRNLLQSAKNFFEDVVRESISANSSFDSQERMFSNERLYPNLISSRFELEEVSRKLFYADLHSISFKNIFFRNNLYRNTNAEKDINLMYLKGIGRHSSLINIKKIQELISTIGGYQKLINHIPNALFFYTRPFNTLELTTLVQQWSYSSTDLNKFNSYLNLFLIPKIKIQVKDFNSVIRKLNINDGKENKNPTIALTSFFTDEKSWIANVREDLIEPDITRFTRLFKILNGILKCEKEINYVVFPELSIPRQLIMYIAAKLKAKKISLIAGIEYAKETDGLTKNINGFVSNQLLYVLNTNNGFYYEQVAVVQEKVIPAFHEERELFDTGGKILEAKSEFKYLIQHGKFFFSGLICNELLNIDYRQPLRGEIDALFVIEWNKDIDMYDPIISSTSNDLHCFMVQVNNREYGDTRLRGPYKEAYKRDKVRVRGGELDYFVVATIDVKALREFQRFHRSPSMPFKPTPTGFKISDERSKVDFI